MSESAHDPRDPRGPAEPPEPAAVDPSTTSAATDASGPPPSTFSLIWRAPLAAVTLLTIIPVPATLQRNLGAREVAASAPFFPLFGAILGVLIGGVAHAIETRSSEVLAAAVATVLLAAVTGALHLDGLADSADALGARGGSRERRLEIMRDSSTGAYGTAAIAAWFVLVAAAIASIPSRELAVVLGLSLALGRGYAIGQAFQLPPARADGLGAGFEVRIVALVTSAATIGVVIAGAVALPADNGWLSGLDTADAAIAVGAAAVASIFITATARRLLGGRTGDTLGAAITVVEAVALVAAALALG